MHLKRELKATSIIPSLSIPLRSHASKKRIESVEEYGDKQAMVRHASKKRIERRTSSTKLNCNHTLPMHLKRELKVSTQTQQFWFFTSKHASKKRIERIIAPPLPALPLAHASKKRIERASSEAPARLARFGMHLKRELKVERYWRETGKIEKVHASKKRIESLILLLPSMLTCSMHLKRELKVVELHFTHRSVTLLMHLKRELKETDQVQRLIVLENMHLKRELKEPIIVFCYFYCVKVCMHLKRELKGGRPAVKASAFNRGEHASKKRIESSQAYVICSS